MRWRKMKMHLFQTKMDFFSTQKKYTITPKEKERYKYTYRGGSVKNSEWCKVDFTNHDRISLSFAILVVVVVVAFSFTIPFPLSLFDSFIRLSFSVRLPEHSPPCICTRFCKRWRWQVVISVIVSNVSLSRMQKRNLTNDVYVFRNSKVEKNWL